MSALFDLIRARTSIRSYDGQKLTEEDREKLLGYARSIENPWGIPVTFVLLDAKEHGLKSPVLTGETLYIAAKVKKVPHGEEAFGFSFEKLVLCAQAAGIGTVWIGGTMNRAVFESATGLEADERMICVTPVGYPAKKRSIRETMMRKAVKADSRKPWEELFFRGDFQTPLTEAGLRDAAGPESAAAADALEMVRLAPSAVNKQPWRVVALDGAYHFYEKKDRGYVSEATGDLQKCDVGIAVCHFVSALEERGISFEFAIRDPEIPAPEDTEYIATVKIKGQGAAEL